MNQNKLLIPPGQPTSVPNYILQIPPHIRYVLGAGSLSGLVGLYLTFAAPETPRPIAYVLLVVGVLAAVLALLLVVVTGNRGRLQARQIMMNAVTWRGDERVLDVGCGNGFLLVEAAKRLTTGKATGIDLWKTDAGQQTADAAWHNAQLSGVADRIEVKNVDARNMPFENNSFDVIVSSLMLHHAGSRADRQQAIQEMIRVVKPGGTIVLYDMLPIIVDASKQMRANEMASLQQSGGVMMKVLSAGKLQ